MPSESIQQAIKVLLAEAAAATAKLDWTTVASLADAALKLDPENADALSIKEELTGNKVDQSDQEIFDSMESEVRSARRQFQSNESSSIARARDLAPPKKWVGIFAAVAVIVIAIAVWNEAPRNVNEVVRPASTVQPSRVSQYSNQIAALSTMTNCSLLNIHWDHAADFRLAADTEFDKRDADAYMAAASRRLIALCD